MKNSMTKVARAALTGLSVALLAWGAAIALPAPELAAQARPGDVLPTLDDPRVGLAAGEKNTAEQASWNMQLVAYREKPPEFDHARGLSFVNSDLAFGGNYVYQGNFSGFMIWDISDPTNPTLMSVMECATDQGDPSIWGNLLFISAESNRARKDCGMQGVQDGADRMRGVRVFDVSDARNPRLVHNIQTCRGSHTHTFVPDPNDPDVMYIYVGGSSSVRSADEMPECSSGPVAENPNTAQFRVDIIRVERDRPEEGAVVGYGRIFEGLLPAGRRGGPSGCHDLTAYPAFNLVAGACGSYGIMLDASNPAVPVRLDGLSDPNFSLWHTAVFNNEATTVVFTDEWGGGTQARCREGDPLRLGGNTILSIDYNGRMRQHAYFKMMAAQTETENCVSHNGGLIPVPGRDIKVQGWYQGGVNVFEFTDPDNPVEIAFFDRGPVDAENLVVGGSWGAYWYNGYIYSSELSRGLDVLELLPSEHLSENEIAAAKLVIMDEYNPQSQPFLTWPPAFPVVRSYLDQLVRNEGLPAARTSQIDQALSAAEAASGTARRDLLNTLAGQLDGDAAGAADADRVRAMAAAVRELAAASN